ncbi:hypothetical protein JCM8202v2_000070 [Rhodotorula sphaerocarpa]
MPGNSDSNQQNDEAGRKRAQELEVKGKEAVSKLLDRYDTFLFDCDGVIWTIGDKDKMTENAAETINYLKEQGKQVAFVTNNGSKSSSEYLEKFQKHGFKIDLEDIHTSGSAAALYVRDIVLPSIEDETKRKIYVIGHGPMEEELKAVGVSWIGGTDPDNEVPLPPSDFSAIQPDPSVGVVLFSFHLQINYKQLTKAFNYLASNEGCRLVSTNDNKAMMLSHGGSAPGAGAIASVLLAALPKGQEPVIVGKPWQPYVDVIQRNIGHNPKRTVFVGDRMQTDVLFAERGGLDSILVWTGRSSPEEMPDLTPEQEPNCTLSHIGALLEAK